VSDENFLGYTWEGDPRKDWWLLTERFRTIQEARAWLSEKPDSRMIQKYGISLSGDHTGEPEDKPPVVDWETENNPEWPFVLFRCNGDDGLENGNCGVVPVYENAFMKMENAQREAEYITKKTGAVTMVVDLRDVAICRPVEKTDD
jgi:hypothetical protein